MIVSWQNIFRYIPVYFLAALPPGPGLTTPTDCLSTDTSSHNSPTTITQLITCLDAYTVPHGYYSDAKHAAAQPTQEERAAWSSTIESLLSVDGDCTSIAIPKTLEGVYTISLFTERAGSSYCILHESQSKNGVYLKGWGLMAVPATRAAILRDIHISAPHPVYDQGTPQQAAALFASTGARSLLIPGRIRTALLAATDCITSTTAQYYKTDPAHETVVNFPFPFLPPAQEAVLLRTSLFFEASKAVLTWQNAHGGCPSLSCAFIQFHGKGPCTCPHDAIFLSSGLGRSASSKAWYTDSVDRPIKRLQAQLRRAFPAWKISLPSESSCALVATTNVVGRLVNGIDETRVCTNGARASFTTGQFIHIEQAAAARTEVAYRAWSEALLRAFEAV